MSLQTNQQPFSTSQTEKNTRVRLLVEGVVQGVGFRPFVYGLALRLGLTGFVGNDSRGVFIEIEGKAAQLAEFQAELVNNPPPLAHIEAVAVEEIPLLGSQSFTIVSSHSQSEANTLISPDLTLCDDCLQELFDPQNRRYQYPFINCTNCGPRFTIVKDIPYDRPFTTMADFKMCPECQAEYENPLNRRFHAQPNACPVCGPHITFQTTVGPTQTVGNSAMALAKQALAEGQIVAVKGIGGFHLACSATDNTVLQKLRERKGRQAKPFAIMVKDIAAARLIAEVSPEEEALLTCRERPIVLLSKKPESNLAELVAPGNASVGVMLPYAPLHYLLIGDTPLVMTSANFTAEPIVKDNDKALIGLAELADAFLLHNRDIYVPCDDSVVRVFEGHELPIRRSRGYAPFPVKLPFTLPPTLAVGGELKSTFCLTKKNYAFMSQHLGDMENLETMEVFSKAYEHFSAIFRVTPQLVVNDMHPRYLSSRWATEFAQRQGVLQVQVQHHHAHIAGVMAENGLDGSSPVLGFAFDGTGYGLDGAIWGGEVLIADYKSFRRAAHLKYTPLPGGDAAIKRPYRLALAQLWAAGLEWDEALPSVQACPAQERKILLRQLETNLNCINTSSIGRLFDAVASLAGVRQVVSYEAQAAIEFEALATHSTEASYQFEVNPSDADSTAITFGVTPLLQELIADVKGNVPTALICVKIHNAVANLIVNLSQQLRASEGLNCVALSGGVFQNVKLLKLTVAGLRANGFEVITHRQVPPNDGGLALGQAVVGNHLI